MDDQTPPTESIVIHAVGDVSPRRADYGEAPESLFTMVHQKIKEADISFGQLEKVLSNKGNMQFRAFPTWRSRVRPENVKSLVFAGFDVVSHASNHCFDYGPEALADSVDIVASNGIKVVGAGKDIIEARKPAIFERKGVMVGFLAYNSVLPSESEARDQKPGCAPIRVSTYYEAQEYQAGTPPKVITIPLEEDVLAMEEDIRKLRKKVHIVVVSLHWGIHHIPGVLAMYQPLVGHRAIDAGADLIVGHHAHLIKGIEAYRGKVIFYSMGNFASEPPRHSRPPGAYDRNNATEYRKVHKGSGTEEKERPQDRQYTMMVKCLASKNGVQKVSFLPGWINERAEPEFLSRQDQRFEDILGYTEFWCRELGTTLTAKGDEIVVYAPNEK